MNQKIIDETTIKFIFVGVVNTIIGTTIMFVSYNIFSLSYWISTALNYVIGSIFSFFLNKFFTFKNTEKSFSQVLRFICTIVFSYVIAYGFAKSCVSYFLSTQSLFIQENISMLVGMIVFTVINYFGQKFFTFFKKNA